MGVSAQLPNRRDFPPADLRTSTRVGTAVLSEFRHGRRVFRIGEFWGQPGRCVAKHGDGCGSDAPERVCAGAGYRRVQESHQQSRVEPAYVWIQTGRNRRQTVSSIYWWASRANGRAAQLVLVSEWQRFVAAVPGVSAERYGCVRDWRIHDGSWRVRERHGGGNVPRADGAGRERRLPHALDVVAVLQCVRTPVAACRIPHPVLSHCLAHVRTDPAPSPTHACASATTSAFAPSPTHLTSVPGHVAPRVPGRSEQGARVRDLLPQPHQGHARGRMRPGERWVTLQHHQTVLQLDCTPVLE